MGDFGKCCDRGTIWQGTPSGKEITLGDIDAYLAVSPGRTTKKGVLVINDALGWKEKNIRLLTDRLAEAGFVAVCPDFYHGDALTMERFKSPGFSLPEWLKAFPNDKVMGECDAVLAELRNSFGVEVFGAIGFCWGGLHATLLNARSAVKAAVVNHGSLLANNKEVLDRIAQPILFQCSDNDSQIPTEFRHEIEAKLSALPNKQHCLMKFYPGQAHGWSLKGDDKDPNVQWAAEDAFINALYFLETFVKV